MSNESRFVVELAGGEQLVGRRRSGSSGLTVLYLHGFGSSQAGEKAEYFRQRAAGAGIGFVSFDFRGHGESGGSLLDLTLSRCLVDIEAVRDHTLADRDGPLVLVGSSMGGLAGLWSHGLAPRGVVAGVYIAPAIGLAQDLPRLVGEAGMEDWRRRGSLLLENELGSFLVGWSLHDDLDNYPVEHLVGLHRKHELTSLVFQGQQDDRVSWRRVDGFAQEVGRSVELVTFAHGDHRLLAEREVIWRRMRGFLAALG